MSSVTQRRDVVSSGRINKCQRSEVEVPHTKLETKQSQSAVVAAASPTLRLPTVRLPLTARAILCREFARAGAPVARFAICQGAYPQHLARSKRCAHVAWATHAHCASRANLARFGEISPGPAGELGGPR